MTAKEYKQKMLQDAFNKRVIFIPEEGNYEKHICEDCSDRMIFALRDNETTFTVGVTTIMECLILAAREGALPELPYEWLRQAESYCDIDLV